MELTIGMEVSFKDDNGRLAYGVICDIDNCKEYCIKTSQGMSLHVHELDIYPINKHGASTIEHFETLVNEVADNIRHQPHYEQFKIQPVTFIGENNLDFLTGNIIKYVLRHNKKDGLKDLEKAKHYLDMLIHKVKTGVVRP